MDHKHFISKDNALAIAPAGHGKTHAIGDCLSHTIGKQLILTHTHAGITSIQDKLKKIGIPSALYNIETISSYAQKLVLSFYTGKDIPPPESGNNFYKFLIEKATILLDRKLIREVITASYCGLFVDEYQDCTTSQHNMIMKLATLFPTRLLGDPLQGIFYFGGEALVNLENESEMGAFFHDQVRLEEPQRWKGINEPLGEVLKSIRNDIESTSSVDFSKYNSVIELHVVGANDLYNFKTPYYKLISKLLDHETILLIDPDGTSVHPRIKKIAMFKNRLILLESIDDKEFYETARIFDNISSESPKEILLSVAYVLFSPDSSLAEWFSKTDFKAVSKAEKKSILEPVKGLVEKFETSRNLAEVQNILQLISKIPNIKCYRKELLRAVYGAVSLAHSNGISVYEAMVITRNKTRRMGRRVRGRCIGTTLLTKGLEFDVVVVLNAHKFDKKNLYVALTRARKRLIVCTEKPHLTFQ